MFSFLWLFSCLILLFGAQNVDATFHPKKPNHFATHHFLRSFRSDDGQQKNPSSNPYLQHAMLSLRGGASESAAAWSAGSKYEYQTNHPNNQSTKSAPHKTTKDAFADAIQTQDDEAVATKDAFAEAFLQRDDRNRFVARVYAILTGQLLVTAGSIHAFHLNPGLQDWIIYTEIGRKVPFIGLIISTISFWIILASERTRQSSLMRWPLLLAFTAGESIAVGFISSVYAYGTVMKAMVTTAISTFSIMAYTHLQKNPKYDLSQWGRGLAGFAIAFLLFGVYHVLEQFGIVPPGFMGYSEAVYCILGAGLFSVYLAHHMRLIVGGKSSKYQMNEKDYIMGAMSLYSDIINIFLYILRLLGDIGDD